MVDKIKVPNPITDETLATRFFEEVTDHIYKLDNPPKKELQPLDIDAFSDDKLKILATKINEIINLLK